MRGLLNTAFQNDLKGPLSFLTDKNVPMEFLIGKIIFYITMQAHSVTSKSWKTLQQERLKAELAGQRFAAGVRLIEALGGGWQDGTPRDLQHSSP